MKDQNAPKRPLSGYMRYTGTIRAEVEAETGLNGIKVTPHLAARWNALSDNEKAKFNEPASKDMAKWSKKMAAYKKTSLYKKFQEAKKAKKNKLKKPKDKNKPKKAMTAYMLFANENRAKVQAELGTKDFGPVGKKISEMWANVDESAKAKYDAKAAKAKAKYEKDFAKYKTTKKYEAYQALVAEWKKQVKENKKALKEQAPATKVVRRRKK